MLNSSIIDYSVPPSPTWIFNDGHCKSVVSRWWCNWYRIKIPQGRYRAGSAGRGSPWFWHSKMPTGTLRIKYMTNGHQSWMFWLYFLQFRHIQTISQQLDFRCKSVPCDSFGRLPPALMERARSLVSGCIASTDIDFNCSNHRYNVYPMRPQLCDIR